MQIILQRESRECGLACIAMIANSYKSNVRLEDLRNSYPSGRNGISVSDLIHIAKNLELNCRALKLEINELEMLDLPTVLHWDLDHYVILERYSKSKMTIIDPAHGRRILSREEVSRSFTGIALEFSPTIKFQEKEPIRKLKISELTGPIYGLKHGLVQLTLIAFSIELIGLGMPQITQLMIDKAITAADEKLVALILISGIILIIVNHALKIANAWISIKISQQISLQWSLNVFSHLLNLPSTYFQNRHIGDVASRFQSLSSIQQFFTSGIVSGITSTALASITLLLMLIYSFKLSLVVIVATFIYAGVRVFFYFPLRDASTEKIILSAKAQSHFLETLKNTSIISRLNISSQRQSTWQNMLIDVQNRDIRTQKLAILFNTSNGIIFGVEGLILLSLGSLSVIGGDISLGMLMAFIAYKSQFTTRSVQLIDIAVNFKLLEIHSERLADIIKEPAKPAITDNVFLDDRKGIQLVNVSYRYSPSSPWILKDVSLEITPGETVAIIGESGSGKSTLIKLLLGQLNTTTGDILIRGVSINKIPPHQFTNLISSAVQGDELISGSISENISRFHSEASQDRISEVSRLANIDHKIRKMPLSYRTSIGELGDAFSGGEKQRLIIARAIYINPSFLILDEATSNLDIHTERHVIKNLAQLGLTQIIVAHRAESISTVSRIIHLAHGSIQDDLISHHKIN